MRFIKILFLCSLGVNTIHACDFTYKSKPNIIGIAGVTGQAVSAITGGALCSTVLPLMHKSQVVANVAFGVVIGYVVFTCVSGSVYGLVQCYSCWNDDDDTPE